MTIEFVRIDDMCHAILDYIASEDFNAAINPEDRNAFMAGMGMASVVVMSRCNKYYDHFWDEDDNKKDRRKHEEIKEAR